MPFARLCLIVGASLRGRPALREEGGCPTEGHPYKFAGRISLSFR